MDFLTRGKHMHSLVQEIQTCLCVTHTGYLMKYLQTVAFIFDCRLFQKISSLFAHIYAIHQQFVHLRLNGRPVFLFHLFLCEPYP